MDIDRIKQLEKEKPYLVKFKPPKDPSFGSWYKVTFFPYIPISRTTREYGNSYYKKEISKEYYKENKDKTELWGSFCLVEGSKELKTEVVKGDVNGK